MVRKLQYNFGIAFESILQNKLRSFLTSLGIIFGVASVIAMLAIGTGAKEEILEKLKFLGTNNLIIIPIVEQKEGAISEEEEESKEVKRFSPGLTLKDAESMMKNIPGLEKFSAEIVLETQALRAGHKRSVKLVGVTSTFFDQPGFALSQGGVFSDLQQESSAGVCIIGSAVKAKFFPKEDAVGKTIKCGKNWLTVVGVVRERGMGRSNLQHLGIRNYDMDIYTPINTMLLRYEDRARITAGDFVQNGGMGGGMFFGEEEEAPPPPTNVNYHQIDRITVTLKEPDKMFAIGEIVQRMLARRHNNVVDFEIHIPVEELKQEQQTKNIFNYVLIAIASISLLVGGIGIMNIMLASVMERIKEIGLRLSIGATRKDIISQFLSEAIGLSVFGGLIGIFIGLGSAYLIQSTTGVRTIVTPASVIISFCVSLSVGVIFGYLPARKAAFQDPVVSLRHE